MAAYPLGEPGWLDDEAEVNFEALQDAVRAIRQVRSDRSVEPGRYIEAYVVDKAGSGALAQRQAVIETLARARPLHVVATRGEAPTEQVVTQLLDRVEVVLPLGGLVDQDAERDRIAKAIADAEEYLGRLQGKLGNAGFRDKAPREVVEREGAESGGDGGPNPRFAGGNWVSWVRGQAPRRHRQHASARDAAADRFQRTRGRVDTPRIAAYDPVCAERHNRSAA